MTHLRLWRRPEPTHLVVFLPNWIGDAAMATPALQAVRQWAATRGLPVVGVMRPAIDEVLEGTELLDEALLYEKGEEKRLVENLRSLPHAVALLMTNSLRTAWMAWRAGCRRRIGYVQDGRRWLLTDPITRPRVGWRRLPRSAVDDYLDLARALGAPTASPRLHIVATPEDQARAAKLWHRWEWGHERVIAFHPGAAYGAAKCWPVEHFASLARRLLQSTEPRRVLVLCGPKETETARSIVALVDDQRVRSLAEAEPSIRLTKGCLARSALLVTGDSGPRHLAAGLELPTVTLFGPTDPVWSHNYHPAERLVELEMDCRPCAQRICPKEHHRCLVDVHPWRVAELVDELLAATRRPAAHLPTGQFNLPRCC